MVISPEFKQWWRQHEVCAPCSGVRSLLVDGQAAPFEHTSLTIDEDQHLPLEVYARQLDSATSEC